MIDLVALPVPTNPSVIVVVNNTLHKSFYWLTIASVSGPILTATQPERVPGKVIFLAAICGGRSHIKLPL